MSAYEIIAIPDNDDIPSSAASVLEADAHLPICLACCTQYPSQRQECPICDDERCGFYKPDGEPKSLLTLRRLTREGLTSRQYVNHAGQQWTSLAQMVEEKHMNELFRDKEDPRISMIHTNPATGIGQTPILIETSQASYVWDLNAFISPPIIHFLRNLIKPLKAIAISHPHFYSTSLTWARALNVPIYIATKDKEWYQRLQDVKEGEIIWYDDDVDLQDNVRLIVCGGHFPGSALMLWDRSKEPPFPSHAGQPLPTSGIIFCADTAMVQPHQLGFTFQFSVPNMIPMDPYDMIHIYTRMLTYRYEQATSTWPNRWIRNGADEKLRWSILRELKAMSLEWRGPPRQGDEAREGQLLLLPRQT